MIRSVLPNCQLFEGMTPDLIERLLNQTHYTQRAYAEEDVIVLQGNRLSHLMILCEGSISAETTDNIHNVLHVERVEAPSLIAPSFLFARNSVLPTTIIAHTSVELITIPKDNFAEALQQNATLLYNFMGIISAQNSFISEHVVYLTYKTIISKLSNYLLKLMEDQKSLTVFNPRTQAQMAEMFGVTRPALARTMGELVKEGAIYVKGKRIEILFSEKLSQYAKK